MAAAADAPTSDSIFTRVGNLINYNLYRATTDPDAKRFADEQNAARKKQEEAVAVVAEKKEVEIKQAKNLEKAKGRDKGAATLIGKIVKYTLLSFMIFIFVLFAVYTGHLAANDAIGRSYWYRILYFIYGLVFCVFVAPYYVIQHFRGHSVKSYAILPIREGEVPQGIEGFFLSLVSFIPDGDSNAAKAMWETAIQRAAASA